MRTKEFNNILRELGWPRIYLITLDQYISLDPDITHSNMRGTFGVANENFPVICIRTNLTGKVRRNTLYHEIAHQLWPNKPHWWIEAYAERMAGGGGKGYYCSKYGHSVDEMPSRKELLELSKRAVRRFNGTNMG
jgi:hypothetical protein